MTDWLGKDLNEKGRRFIESTYRLKSIMSKMEDLQIQLLGLQIEAQFERDMQEQLVVDIKMSRAFKEKS